jgi:hypothetical protein
MDGSGEIVGRALRVPLKWYRAGRRELAQLLASFRHNHT